MAWYNDIGKENDVVVSSRIRFARNIADYPFESKMDDTSAKEIIEKVTKALGTDFESIDLSELTSIEAEVGKKGHHHSHILVVTNFGGLWKQNINTGTHTHKTP